MITISCVKFTKLVSAGLSPPAENSNMFGTASAVACNCLYLPSIRMSKCFAISYKLKGFAIFLSIELHRKEVDKESDQSELIVNTERYV